MNQLKKQSKKRSIFTFNKICICNFILLGIFEANAFFHAENINNRDWSGTIPYLLIVAGIILGQFILLLINHQSTDEEIESVIILLWSVIAFDIAHHVYYSILTRTIFIWLPAIMFDGLLFIIIFNLELIKKYLMKNE